MAVDGEREVTRRMNRAKRKKEKDKELTERYRHRKEIGRLKSV